MFSWFSISKTPKSLCFTRFLWTSTLAGRIGLFIFFLETFSDWGPQRAGGPQPEPIQRASRQSRPFTLHTAVCSSCTLIVHRLGPRIHLNTIWTAHYCLVRFFSHLDWFSQLIGGLGFPQHHTTWLESDTDVYTHTLRIASFYMHPHNHMYA